MPRTPISTSYTSRTKPATTYTKAPNISTPSYSTPRKTTRGLLTDYWLNTLTDYNGNELTSMDTVQINKITTNYS